MKIKELNCANCGKLISFSKNTKPKVCPECGCSYWDKPEIEYQLFKIQDEYFESGKDEKVLGKMYDKLEFYSEMIIKKKLKGKGKCIPEEIIMERASELAFIIIDWYKRHKDEDYKIDNSFGGMLGYCSLGVLFSDQKEFDDSTCSLDLELAKNFSIASTPSSFISDISDDKAKLEKNAYDEYEHNHPEELVDIICESIHDTYLSVKKYESKRDRFLFLVLMFLYLKKNPKCSVDSFYERYGDNLKYYLDETLENIKEILNGK